MKKPAKYLLMSAVALLTSALAFNATAQEKDRPLTSADRKDSITSDPNVTENDPQIIAAKKEFARGQIGKCKDLLEKAAKENALLPPAELMLARLMLSVRDQQMVQTGRQLLELAIAANPQHPEVYLTNGSLALAEGRITDTLFNCALALQLSEDARWGRNQRRTFQKEARAGMATGFEARRDWTSCRPHLSAWMDLDPTNNQIRQRLARALFMSNKTADREESLDLLNKAAEQDRTLEPPLIQLGMLAVSLVGQEIKEGPNAQAKNFYENLAKDYFNRAAKDYAKDPTKLAKVHQALASWYLDKGEFDKAQEEISNAEKLEGTKLSRGTKSLMGLMARYKGDFAAAEQIFSSLVALYPGDVFLQNQLALVLVELGAEEQKRAVAMADANARQNSRSAEGYATLAWCLFKTDKPEDANKAIVIATSNGQASADTAYYLAEILAAAKPDADYEKAFENVEKAVDSKGVFVNRKRGEALKTKLEPLAKAQKKEREEKERAEKEKKEREEKEKKDKENKDKKPAPKPTPDKPKD